MSKIIYFLFIIFIWTSCYVMKEGCLDTLANNYDVTSDDACADCCQFPKLTLTIVHGAGDSTFNREDVFENEFNQKYQLSDIRYYLSGFTMYQNEKNWKIEQKISSSDGATSIEDDMKIVRIADNDINIGTVRTYGRFDSLTFFIGINSTMQLTDFVSLPTAHVLTPDNKLKDDAKNTVQCVIRLIRKDSIDQPLNVYISGENQPIPVALDSMIITNKGDHFRYKTRTDYLRLFKNIDLNQDIKVIEKQASENLKTMFVVK